MKTVAINPACPVKGAVIEKFKLTYQYAIPANNNPEGDQVQCVDLTDEEIANINAHYPSFLDMSVDMTGCKKCGEKREYQEPEKKPAGTAAIILSVVFFVSAAVALCFAPREIAPSTYVMNIPTMLGALFFTVIGAMFATIGSIKHFISKQNV